jgi:hypothetical protein
MICLSTNPLCSLRTVSFLVQLLWSVARKIWFDIKRHLVAQCRRKRRPERERSNWNTFQTAPTQNEKIFLPAPYANVGHHRWIERNWVISRLFKLRALMKFVRTRRGTFRVSRLGHTFDRIQAHYRPLKRTTMETFCPKNVAHHRLPKFVFPFQFVEAA